MTSLLLRVVKHSSKPTSTISLGYLKGTTHSNNGIFPREIRPVIDPSQTTPEF